MGFPVGLECSWQAQPAVLLSGVGEHSASILMHTQQVCSSLVFFNLPYKKLVIVFTPTKQLLTLSKSLPPGCEFGQADMQKLVPKEEKPSSSTPAPAGFGAKRTGNINI